jgi:hypothetical protein
MYNFLDGYPIDKHTDWGAGRHRNVADKRRKSKAALYMKWALLSTLGVVGIAA